MTQQTNKHTIWIRVTLALGAALLSANQAEAQWGGGYGGWGGYGAFWGAGVGRYGMSLSQLNFYRMQAAAQNASRYNLNNAMAAQAYQAANMYRQSAIDEMFNTRMKAQQYAQAKYGGGPYYGGQGYGGPAQAPMRSQLQRPAGNNGRAAAGVQPGVQAGAQPAAPAAGFDQMIARDGEVFWPLGAPDQGELGAKRAAASDAIKSVIQQAQSGPVSVRRVVHARNALADYAVPAALALKQDRPDDVDGFADYVKTLDAGLRSLATNGGATARAGTAPATQPGTPARSTRTPNIEPDSAPESAGKVLQKSLESQSGTPHRER